MKRTFEAAELEIKRLGDPTIPSPLKDALFVEDEEGVASTCLRSDLTTRSSLPGFFEMAGPRRTIFFDPTETTCAIVTCGGLCPGLNDVIRGLTMQLYEGYNVRQVLGLRYGYQSLVESYGHKPLVLTASSVGEIHRRGGTVLKSSRGDQDPVSMVDSLERLGIDVLFVVGGDGTMRGASAIVEEIERRGGTIGVVGIPKTIDNDIPVIQKTFGFETAVAEAVRAIDCGHIEAHDNPRGVAVVKLMGRDAGFIAAAATVASGDVNFCLVPEVEFGLGGKNGLYDALARRLDKRGHAVIVVAEGAGEELCETAGTDDIGILLRDRLKAEFARRGEPLSLKYIDPSYMIRSVPATADDSVFCAQLAHHAVHAAMAGRTSMLTGYYHDHFVHIPLRLVIGHTKQLDLSGKLWRAVLESTGQPREWRR